MKAKIMGNAKVSVTMTGEDSYLGFLKYDGKLVLKRVI